MLSYICNFIKNFVMYNKIKNCKIVNIKQMSYLSPEGMLCM